MSGAPSGSPGGSQDQEFMVRIPPRNEQKKYHIMKFNASLNIDPAKWTQVRMIRENNRKEFVREDDDVPEFGAGSEFGRKEKEEARRKKFGINTRRYNPDNQPWLMRVGGKKDGKQYKGIREGGINENTAYYIFTHAADGSFEAHPVKEWYNFTPRTTYRTLNAEEAEEKFAERGKILNHFAVMVNRKLRPNQDDADGDIDDEGSKGKKGKGSAGKDLKVSDMDDWVDSEDEPDSDDDGDKKKKNDSDDDEDGGGKKNSRSKDSKKKNKKKNKDEVDDEAFEDSDDGDEEGLEVDYMSDESSDSEEELIAGADIKGVDQDKALSRMLDSESSSESDNEEKKKENEEEEKKEEEDAGKKGKKKKETGEGKRSTKSSANNSRSTTPTPTGGEPGDKGEGGQANDEKTVRAEKRKALVDNLLDPNADSPAAKKLRPDPFSSSSSSVPPPPPANSMEAIFEEYARKYLARKPMTTTELLRKFKSKKTDLPNEELMPILVNVLKRINPHKQKIKGTMYLSLKSEK